VKYDYSPLKLIVMRKFLILAAVLLFGVGSVFAQAWTVDVAWTFTPNSDCHTQLTSQYGFSVALEIKDTANDSIVSTPVQTGISWTATGTTFYGNETLVEDYCDGNPPNTPSFQVTAVVRIYHLSTYNVFCTRDDSDSGISCSEFGSNGVALTDVLFD